MNLIMETDILLHNLRTQKQKDEMCQLRISESFHKNESSDNQPYEDEFGELWLTVNMPTDVECSFIITSDQNEN